MSVQKVFAVLAGMELMDVPHRVSRRVTDLRKIRVREVRVRAAGGESAEDHQPQADPYVLVN
jgi:hypothetical protein